MNPINCGLVSKLMAQYINPTNIIQTSYLIWKISFEKSKIKNSSNKELKYICKKSISTIFVYQERSRILLEICAGIWAEFCIPSPRGTHLLSQACLNFHDHKTHIYTFMTNFLDRDFKCKCFTYNFYKLHRKSL